MAKVLVKHDSSISTLRFEKLIQELRAHFPKWSFKLMGAFRTRKDSIHYHITSKNRDEGGTLEITYDPELNGKLELKLSANRTGSWGKAALEKLLKYLKKG